MYRDDFTMHGYARASPQCARLIELAMEITKVTNSPGAGLINGIISITRSTHHQPLNYSHLSCCKPIRLPPVIPILSGTSPKPL
jgi:hypothetical protein